MPVEKGWHFALSGAGRGSGFNHPGIDHFKKESSLWREVKQNVGDNIDETINSPAKIIYKIQEYDSSLFGLDENFKIILENAYKRFLKLSDKEDGKKFYEKALNLINEDKVSVFKMRDFNTTGLYGNPYSPGSSFYRLLVAEGASSFSGRGGGSHGHGQNAPYARSNYRSVFYYSYVDNGIEGTNHKDLFAGKSILNEWKDHDDKRRQSVGYYGNLDSELIEQYQQVPPLFGTEIPKSLKRTAGQTGTDIYILGSNLGHMWKHSCIVHSLNHFFASIEHGLLEVGIQDGRSIKYINKTNIDGFVEEKNSPVWNYLKALREPLNGKPFEREIENLGTVKLYISLHDEGNKKIVLMRRPRMKIKEYDKPTLSNYSGVLIVDDKQGNENMRLLEDPEHRKLERYREVGSFGEDAHIISDLEKFIDDTLNDLRSEQATQNFTLPLLGELFPDPQASVNPGDVIGEGEDEENTLQIPEDLNVTVSDKILLTQRRLSATLTIGGSSGGGFGGGSGGAGGGSGGGFGGSGGLGEDRGGVISVKDVEVRTHESGVRKGLRRYRAIVRVKDDCEGWIGFKGFGIDNVTERMNITDFNFDDESGNPDSPDISGNRLHFGKLKKGERFSFTFTSGLKVKSAIRTEG